MSIIWSHATKASYEKLIDRLLKHQTHNILTF